MKQTQLNKVLDSNNAEMLFIASLSRATVICGINQQLSGKESKFITEALANQFPFISIEQVDEAFELYATDKLDIDIKKEFNLNLTFIGKILSSYQRYRAKNNTTPQRALPEAPGKPVEQLEQEAWEVMERFIQRNDPTILNGFCWQHLFRYGAKNRLLNLDRDSWEMFKENCRVEIETQSRRKGMNHNSKEGIETAAALKALSEPDSFDAKCRMMFMKEYITNKLN